MTSNAVGGYFQLELATRSEPAFPHARRFQSARASFIALLRVGRPKRVWMPRYICDSVRAALQDAGVECVHYGLDQEFNIVGHLALRSDDWLYYVNYFGIGAASVDRVLATYNPNQVVLDYCQAFFAPQRRCLALIYSPRKFFGVPDGGLLVTDLDIPVPAEIDRGSVDRARYLLERLDASPEAGYSSYKVAEQSLEQMEPRRISQLSSRMLDAVDVDRAREIRNENFAFLHQVLGQYNLLTIDHDQINGPMCYPFLRKADGLKSHLINNRIFVPTYWDEVLQIVASETWEAFLVRNLCPLPCDQRYSVDEMKLVAEMCGEYVGT